MTLKAAMAADATAVFLNTDEFAENVTYIKPDGSTRSIAAIVNRRPLERIDGNGRVVTPKMEITVANSATTGISTAELNAFGNDKIRVAYRIGGTTEDHPVCIPDVGDWQDEGMITLDLK